MTPSGISETVVVTGGSGGIGSAIVASLIADGVSCLNIDVAPPRTGNEQAGYMSCDFNDLGAVDALCEALLSSNTKISGLVHCAGITQGQDAAVQGSLLAEESRENWLRILAVNLIAPIALTQGLTPALQPGGSVVFFGSGTILKGLPRYTVYIASKAGLVGFSRSLAAELGPREITVNTVSPGLTATSMNDNVPQAQLALNINGRAIKRDEVPDDVVGAVRFFLSPASRFVTGQMLVVDGGSTRH